MNGTLWPGLLWAALDRQPGPRMTGGYWSRYDARRRPRHTPRRRSKR